MNKVRYYNLSFWIYVDDEPTEKRLPFIVWTGEDLLSVLDSLGVLGIHSQITQQEYEAAIEKEQQYV